MDIVTQGLIGATVAQAGARPNEVRLASIVGFCAPLLADADALIQTPNIDQLASGGMVFTDGHSSSGVCSPSRFAILTGQHHWRRHHGCRCRS